MRNARAHKHQWSYPTVHALLWPNPHHDKISSQNQFAYRVSRSELIAFISKLTTHAAGVEQKLPKYLFDRRIK